MVTPSCDRMSAVGGLAEIGAYIRTEMTVHLCALFDTRFAI
jgi:hypothetical protein